MATMRKLSILAVNGGGAAISIATATRHRVLQPPLYHTGSNFSSQLSKSQYNFSGDMHDAGHKQWVAMTTARYFSAAAASPSASVVFAEKELPGETINERYVPKEVVLYQYEACPFCNKVKAFLDYHDIRYKIVEVNPINKKEIKWSDYKKVPILLVDGEQMVNSSDIIDNLFQRMHLDKSLGSITDNDEVQKWRRWVDDDLVHVLSPNIYRTASEALESFDYITRHGNFSFTERLVAKYAGATAMYFVSKKLKKKYNITDERGALYAAAEAWVDALQGREFLGGSEPTLADLAVFGVLRPIRYLKSGKDMVENTLIGDWYARMETEMQHHRDLKPQATN